MRYCAKSQLTKSPKRYLIIIIIELSFSNTSLSPQEGGNEKRVSFHSRGVRTSLSPRRERVRVRGGKE